MQFKRLNENSLAFGVCSGIAYRLGVPALIVRLLFLFLTTNGSGILYFLIVVLTDRYDIDPDDANDV